MCVYRLGDVTLKDVKQAVDCEGGHLRYHFKALDPEFGTVKEEVRGHLLSYSATINALACGCVMLRRYVCAVLAAVPRWSRSSGLGGEDCRLG